MTKKTIVCPKCGSKLRVEMLSDVHTKKKSIWYWITGWFIIDWLIIWPIFWFMKIFGSKKVRTTYQKVLICDNCGWTKKTR